MAKYPRGESVGFALSELKVSSPAFAPGGPMPRKHTAMGDDLSPELEWVNVPDGVRSFAVICHDPDAPLVRKNGTYGLAHWVLYNIPATATGVPEGVHDRYTTGPNELGERAYHGPKPPPGHGTHHYVFTLLALDLPPDLEDGLSLWDLLARVEPNVVGMNRLVGTFENAGT
jgi:Raf kinase inhibitor-like YbhB/YbcL family protein